MPTLVVWGEADQGFTREEQERLAAGIPGARLLTIPDAGHEVHWERPELFERFLRDFVPA